MASIHLPSKVIAPFTTLGLGGPAREFAYAHDEPSLIAAVHEADLCSTPVLLLGAGSNTVVSDAGFDGRVVLVQTREITVEPSESSVLVSAAAGEPWDALVALCVSENLAGIECLSGIPGSVGATPVQNVGAYGQELSDTLYSVRVYDRHAHTTLTLTAPECALSYRDSAFKRARRGRYVLLSVTLALRPRGVSVIRYGELSRALGGQRSITDLTRVREAVISLRRAKSMVLDPSDPESRSVGSFFVNPLVTTQKAHELEAKLKALGVTSERSPMPRFEAEGDRVKLAAAWLIERAGFARGWSLGGVGVSKNHSLALVNRGGTALELVALARHIRATVRERFGVELAPEPVFVGFSGDDPTS